MIKVWLVLAAVLGFLSVAFGAFGAHSLKNFLDEYGKSIWEKAVLYQMFHTLALLAVGLSQLFIRNASFSIAGYFFLAGTLLFSGSLYLLAITGTKWLGVLTPFGGVAFLLGWASFAYTMIKAKI